MSRVDDDRDAARAAARLAEAKRTEEAKRTQKAGAEAAFSKLVAKQTAKPPPPPPAPANAARSAIARALEEAEAKGTLQGKEASAGSEAKASAGASTSRRQASHGQQAQSSARAESTRQEQSTAATERRASDGAQTSKRAEGQQGDAKLERASKERGAAKSGDSARAGETEGGAAGAGAAGAEGAHESRTDADGGGQQGGQKDKGESAAAAGFRFNPALMAPVPVAQKKDMAGSERLRRLAAELAQKIVERVRVGTNTAGRVEFQIDLRSDVLAGLSVKVSSQNGKIRATFTGHDKDVLKLIESQGDALKEALQSRGLSLEDFKVERR